MASVWYDIWDIQCPLINHLSPRDISREGYNLQSRVADLFSNEGWMWPQDWLMKASNLNMIQAPNLDVNTCDSYFWCDVNGNQSVFLVRCVWETIRPRGNEVMWFKMVWFSHCIPRHAFHLWLVMQNSLRTQDKLRQWDISGNTDLNLPTCAFCDAQPDSHSHLFFDCHFSTHVWFYVHPLAIMEDVSPVFNNIMSHLQPLAKTRTAKSVIGLGKDWSPRQKFHLRVVLFFPTPRSNWDNVGLRLTKIEHTQALMQADLSSIKTDTSKIKSMMTETFQAFKVQSSTPSSSMPQTTLAITEGPSHVRGRMSDRLTLKPPFYTKEEHVAMDDDTEKPESDKAEEEPKNAVPISAVKPTETPTPEDPDELIKVPYMINGKMYHLTNDEINAHMEKEDKIKKAAKEAKMCEMTKTEVIKVVQKEAEKIRLDYKIIFSVKVGEKFKKAQDVKHQVIKIEHSQKVKRLMDLNKKRVEQYIVPELDELGPIIQKKKKIVKDLMISLGKSLPEGVPFVNNMVIEEPKYVIFFTDVFGDQSFQRWNDIHKVGIDSLVSYLVMASMIKTSKNARLRLKLKKLIAEHPDQEKLQSKRVKLDAVG
ncbi:retrovirus-related pol polyprotein from transposon TNT 1-94 [Tanacetum coccineum]